MSFYEKFGEYDYSNFKKYLDNEDKDLVLNVLKKEKINFFDYLYLLSNGAKKVLPQIASLARELTIKRFGKVINFYAPIYLSNECSNSCIYCGFNHSKEIKRTTLTKDEIEKELIALKEVGFDSVLLLTGESPKIAGLDYIKEAVIMAKKYFTYIGLEIYPMSEEEYRELVKAGANGLTIYQETYHKETYDKVHLKGRKKNFEWRLDTPDRAFLAGFRKVGIGALLGLYDLKYEASIIGLHAEYLQKKYWRGEVTLSFPRINPKETGFDIPYSVTDKDLVQMLCALRIFLPDTPFLLSTREKPEFRDKLIELCITQMSAGSKTNPGGYTKDDAKEQFEVSDKRSLSEMLEVVKNKGYDPVLKDWEENFLGII